MSNLTIWRIAPGMMDLLIQREEAISDEKRAAAQQELTEYVREQMTPARVAYICGAIKHAALMATAAKVEAAAQKARADQWEVRAGRLKAICVGLMEEAGIKRLDGSTGGLRIQGSGGKEPVVITDASLIPDEYVVYEGRISGPAWARLWENNEEILMSDEVEMERKPLRNAIHADLEKSIPVPGCHLGERGQTLRVE